MKPRHAAALALVGWYLMVPPTAAVTRHGVKQRVVFDTHQQCYEYKRNLIVACQKAHRPISSFASMKCVQFEDRQAN
jgi:hypothetical protein